MQRNVGNNKCINTADNIVSRFLSASSLLLNKKKIISFKDFSPGKLLGRENLYQRNDGII